ncbi:hypothetical protein ILYODFUR_030625 [Ilyodon furcidens]|uniref:Uncharacterized protein n=1 Tax=Ilyodon furcidens TaxID=33524 RepID=A0ABV0UCU5_9TELE
MEALGGQHPVGHLVVGGRIDAVTRGMFGATRKKFMEGGIESEYASDDSGLYYSHTSMFAPHRADKDVSL